MKLKYKDLALNCIPYHLIEDLRQREHLALENQPLTWYTEVDVICAM